MGTLNTMKKIVSAPEDEFNIQCISKTMKQLNVQNMKQNGS